MKFVAWVLVNALGIAVAAWLFEGISFDGATSGQAEIEDKILPLLGVALIFSLVTAWVAPIVKLLSLPLVILTLGLFLFVVNAAMFLLTGWLADQFDIPFHVEGFWTALGASIVITVVTWLVEAVTDTEVRG
ncbi:putative membrane protein [Nocardioides zeae]|uniref:Membrane protein n=2 Tax=Nocardioides zeae TaxID=1457234 RepID=A0AAJ1U7K4_9ACTN|nr:phage holin family protein [Nocardioides zeae]MDQ1105881.1 putative membrane protein [Nocardioides zeae]MDR6174473.1 putative membrane protein [Nocardioides zeae]MDR6210545.1 putative membrane protein [Nocardioides zeae]